MSPKKIAIVGSGVSGISALYALKNTGHDVHLYEAAERWGGHTNTIMFKGNDGNEVPVDTGFIVLNTYTYPNFIAFLKELSIPTTPTEMTFGISRDQGAFEWSGTSLSSIFAQRSNVLRPQMWRMIFDIVRFNQFALDLLEPSAKVPLDLTIGEYLSRNGYSASFRDDYLIPMTACVWSTGPDKCALEFPAVTLVRFLWNHHLLSTISERPDWLTIPGGSKRYLDAVLSQHPKEKLHLKTPVASVLSVDGERVEITFSDGRKEHFDDVILACHGDQARSIIEGGATKEEMEILKAFETTPNEAYLHSDLSLMPTRRLAWSAWNYLITSSASSSQTGPEKVTLTYDMNTLQHLPSSKHGHVLVTLNPPKPPSPSLTQARVSYAHPLYNPAAIASQQKLPSIQGKRGIWYAGAWTAYGFHEDGFSSGLRVATDERLGGKVSWKVQDARKVRGETAEWGLRKVVIRAVVTYLWWWIWALDIVVGLAFGKPEAKAKDL